MHNALLHIDFDGAADRIRHEKMHDAEDSILKIKNMYDSGGDALSIYASLPPYHRNRIRYAADNLDMGIDEVIACIAESDENSGKLMVALIMSSAVRTGYQERLQKTVIEQQSSVVRNIRKLPNGGKNALRIQGARKSVDFIADAVGKSGQVYNLYFAAKYTQDEGGAQDNQCNDLMEFASCIDHLPPNSIIILLSDGIYYDKRRKKFNNHSFHDWINNDRHHDRVLSTSTPYLDINLQRMLDAL